MDDYVFFRADDGEIKFERTTSELAQVKGQPTLPPVEAAELSLAAVLGNLNTLGVALCAMGEDTTSAFTLGLWRSIFVMGDSLGLVPEDDGHEEEDADEVGEWDETEGVTFKFRQMDSGEIFTVRYWLDPENGYSWQTRYQRGEYGTLAGGDGFEDQRGAHTAAVRYLTEQQILGPGALQTLSGSMSGREAQSWGGGLLN